MKAEIKAGQEFEVEFGRDFEAEEYIVHEVISWSEWFLDVILFPCLGGEERLVYYYITWQGGVVSPGTPILH